MIFLKHEEMKLVLSVYSSSSYLIYLGFYRLYCYMGNMVRYQKSNTGRKIFVHKENYYLHIITAHHKENGAETKNSYDVLQSVIAF